MRTRLLALSLGIVCGCVATGASAAEEPATAIVRAPKMALAQFHGAIEPTGRIGGHAPAVASAEEQEGQLREALERAKVKSGLASDLVITATIALADYLGAQGRASAAEQLLRHAIVAAGTAATNPPIVGLQISLADNLSGQNRYAEAESVYRLALTCIASAGDHALELALAARKLGILLGEQKRFTEADEYLRRALDLRIQTLGQWNYETSISTTELANNLLELDRYADAEAMYRRGYEIDLRLFGEADASILVDLGGIASALEFQERYTEAEPLLRRKLTLRVDALGMRSIDVAEDADDLAFNLGKQNRLAEAESLLRVGLRVTEGAKGSSIDTAVALGRLATNLDEQGNSTAALPLAERQLEMLRGKASDNGLALRLLALGNILSHQGMHAEAEIRFREALRIFESAPEPIQQSIGVALGEVGDAIAKQGRYDEAQGFFERSLAVHQKVATSRNDTDVAIAMGDLGGNLRWLHRFGEAERLLREQLRIDEAVYGPSHLRIATDLESLGNTMVAVGQYRPAEAILRRSLTLRRELQPLDHPDVADTMGQLASMLHAAGRTEESEALYREQWDLRLRRLGPDHEQTLLSRDNLAVSLSDHDKLDEAEALLRETLAIREASPHSDPADLSTSLYNLAGLLDREGRLDEAVPLIQRAVKLRLTRYGPADPDTLRAQERLGNLLRQQERYREAIALLRPTCRALSDIARSSDLELGRSSSADAKLRASTCGGTLARALWQDATARAASLREADLIALRSEAFEAAQLALQSDAGEALSQSGARSLAMGTPAGEAAIAYESARLRQRGLLAEFAATAGDANAKPERRAETADALKDTTEQARIAGDQLKALLPRYWEFRAPAAVSIAELQSSMGHSPPLLRDDEALLLVLARPGTLDGLVIAVSRSASAWANLPEGNEEILRRVEAMRAQLIPRQTSGGSTRLLPFDRAAAHQLFKLLLGDPAIAAVVADKTLLVAAGGALIKLPFEALVTRLPIGEAATADDRELTRTAWLLREHAVAVLPAVATLRTVRGRFSTANRPALRSLLAFANPQTRPSGTRDRRPEGSAELSDQSRQLGATIASLPRLPFARRESDLLQRAIGDGRHLILTDTQASKTNLRALNRGGALAQFRVVEFATHALPAGSQPAFKEQALVLAGGDRPEDAVLTTSEAAALRLNADWVLLSACESSGAAEDGGQEFSGLASAFFYAGARSILATYWPIRDDAASRIVPAVLTLEKKIPTLSRAQALQKAVLAELDRPNSGIHHPSLWAAFTLIGEAGR